MIMIIMKKISLLRLTIVYKGIDHTNDKYIFMMYDMLELSRPTTRTEFKAWIGNYIQTKQCYVTNYSSMP